MYLSFVGKRQEPWNTLISFLTSSSHLPCCICLVFGLYLFKKKKPKLLNQLFLYLLWFNGLDLQTCLNNLCVHYYLSLPTPSSWVLCFFKVLLELGPVLEFLSQLEVSACQWWYSLEPTPTHKAALMFLFSASYFLATFLEHDLSPRCEWNWPFLAAGFMHRVSFQHPRMHGFGGSPLILWALPSSL